MLDVAKQGEGTWDEGLSAIRLRLAPAGDVVEHHFRHRRVIADDDEDRGCACRSSRQIMTGTPHRECLLVVRREAVERAFQWCRQPRRWVECVGAPALLREVVANAEPEAAVGGYRLLGVVV